MSSYKQRKKSEIVLAIGVIAVVTLLIFIGQSISDVKKETYKNNFNTEKSLEINADKKICLESDEDCLFAGCNGFY